MNAYEFYLSTSKYVLLADPFKKSSWVDLYSYLPCLRQMLSCCVCGNIMLKPKGPSHGFCLHHVCSSCIGGKMRLRPACSWCRIHDGFVENLGMRILILCFKKMCEYINSSAIGEQIRKAATNGAHTNTLIRVLDEAVAFEDDYVVANRVMPTCMPTYGMAPEPKLVSFPRGPQGHTTAGPNTTNAGGRARNNSTASAELRNINKDKATPLSMTDSQSDPKTPDKDTTSTSNGHFNGDELDRMPALLAPCTRGIVTPEKLSPPLAGPQRADVLDQQDPNLWTHVTRSGHYGDYQPEKLREPVSSPEVSITPASQKLANNQLKSKLKTGFSAKQTKLKIKGKYQKKQRVFKYNIDFEPPCKRTRLASSLTVPSTPVSQPSRKVCKCVHMNSPSCLTCFGQRCPCYSNRLPCVSCMCRGCRNPRKEPALLRNGDDDKSDGDLDPPMPILSPEPKF